jgi:hypothetical protein
MYFANHHILYEKGNIQHIDIIAAPKLSKKRMSNP